MQKSIWSTSVYQVKIKLVCLPVCAGGGFASAVWGFTENSTSQRVWANIKTRATLQRIKKSLRELLSTVTASLINNCWNILVFWWSSFWSHSANQIKMRQAIQTAAQKRLTLCPSCCTASARGQAVVCWEPSTLEWQHPSCCGHHGNRRVFSQVNSVELCTTSNTAAMSQPPALQGT